MSLQVVTANRLDDGLVVFLTASGAWETDINRARTVEDKDGANALLAQAEAPEHQIRVVGPYLIDVAMEEDGLVPTKYREVLRTKGPSVRLDLGFQAG